jgi:hypothetical protein
MNLKRIENCRKGKRCNAVFSCKYCATTWQKKHFKAFIECLPRINTDIITYYVVRCYGVESLNSKLTQIFNFIDRLKELKKRNKLPPLYARIEVSYRDLIGFNPHINIVLFSDDYSEFKTIAKELHLKLWKRKKQYSEDIAKSLIWYILKPQKLNIQRGEIVRIAFNKRNQIFKTKEFNFNLNTINENELINLDFSFMGTMPIRTKEELELRAKIREMRREINRKFKEELAKLQSRR